MNYPEYITKLHQDVILNQYQLGMLYSQGPLGVRRYDVAVNCFTAISDNLSDATFQLGMLYHIYGNMTWDFPKAKRFLEKAVSQGHLKACMYLDIVYGSYLGGCRRKMTKAKFKEAKAQLEVLAEQNRPEVQLALGNWYFYRCTKEDFCQAFQYFSQAAELGNIDALRRLATMYHEGLGVKRDNKLYKEYNAQADKLRSELTVEDMVASWEIEGQIHI